MPDVVVVGAGIVGAACAYYAARELVDTQAHQAILRRLREGGIVSTVKADPRKSNLRVDRKR
ncbi:FAD-dependent oxidoreductase [Micromonospora musae]|uniref:FAD-dependent oxidoreductase n=1 Tax=Micromonospora musae TaxID=1894970 RepID=UPI0013158CC5|nr:FAD-dependent oxidoreductase [Micromonospora musae]